MSLLLFEPSPSNLTEPKEIAVSAIGPRQCPVCNVALQACWTFRADDRHCGLCGLRILRLVVKDTAPDGAIWLYHTPRRHVLLRMTWERGLDDRPQERLLLRPVLDFRACRARFGGDRGPGLEFRLEEAAGASEPHAVTARLVPTFDGFDKMDLPPRGLAGEVVVASAAGTETLIARLLPVGREVVLECADPSVTRRDGVWRIFRHSAAAVPMRLTVHVAQWALRVGRNTEPESEHEVTLTGLQTPVLLEPGKAYPFDLCIDGANCPLLESKPFAFQVDRVGLPPLPLAGRIALIPGCRLQFDDGTVRAVDVRLGRKAAISVPIIVSDAPLPSRPLAPTTETDDDAFKLEVDSEEQAPPNALTIVRESGISVTEYIVQQAPGGAAGPCWLRVLSPRREQLPWFLPVSERGRPTVDLNLEVDTTALDRERYHGAVLRGAVELIDSCHRRWRCEVQASVARPARLASYVAVDWGTTNSCAAYRKGIGPGDEPLSISFDEEQRGTPELFPSDMYFEDISDPENPVFRLGNEAVRKAREHPECRLRSVKRKFQFIDRVSVMDERGRCREYTTADLARFLLRRLIALAEVSLGQEIHNLALTFPTKWSARVRDKLAGVARALAIDLGRERAPYSVAVLPPLVDEATAVALNFITSDHGRAHLAETFYLVAYDFGGGTVDTAVLEVHLPSGGGCLSTRYVGLGGRSDFGGDDVTRAVMGCLRDRITMALRRRTILLDTTTGRTARLVELPLVPDGAPLRGDLNGSTSAYQLGRKNWDALWKIAELIKIDLCAAEALAPARPSSRLGGASGGDSDFGAALALQVEEAEQILREADRHPAVNQLRPRLADISCHVAIQPGPGEVIGPEDVVWTLDAVLDPLDADDRDNFFRELGFTLNDVCTYELEDVYETNGGRPYTVRQRVEDTVRELVEQCRDRGVKPDVIVLAGGGCRLPLVAETMRAYFQSDHDLLLYSKDFAKRRVAHGMASYLALRQATDLDRHLAQSVDVVHHPLGVQRLVTVDRGVRIEFVTVVPVGAPLDGDAAVFSFSFTAAQLRRSATGTACLPLFRRDWHRGALEFGSFDLGQPAGQSQTARALPVVPGTTYAGELRLHGLQDIELMVRHEGATYGPFLLDLAGGEFDDLR